MRSKTKPPYTVGQGVFYPYLDSFGTVRAVLGDDRYEVEFRSRGELWSVAGSALSLHRTSTHKKKSKIVQEARDAEIATRTYPRTELWLIGGVYQPVTIRRIDE